MKTSPGSRRNQPPIKDSQRAKKPTGKRVGAYGKTPVRVNKQPVVKRSRLSGCLMTLGAIATLITSGGLVVGGIWLALLLMLDPNGVIWLNQFLPEWTRIPVTEASPPQTLAAIQDEVTKSGLIPGEPISLDSGGASNETSILLPISASLPNCQTDCEQIVELRVYQPTELRAKETYYQLVSQLSIAGPEEYAVVSTPADTEPGNSSLSRSLPLTKFVRFENSPPEEGFWFNVSGQLTSGDLPKGYGQVIHYNPDQMHLSVMLQWTSPHELQPYWQEVTGASKPELVVNETVGLEPKFKVYQIKPRNFVPNPIYLEEISLAQPAFDTQAYRNALILARKGLWSPARQLLQSQKKQKWSPTAQAQMDLIQLHAQVTESQAKQAWATPGQQILAHLIDGRWSDALLVFQASSPGAPVQEIAAMLKADSGQLWQRLEAALKVNPDDDKVKAWGALILASQQDRSKAIAWLQQLSSSKTDASTQEPAVISNQIYELLDHLEAAFAATSLASNHWSQIVGTAQAVTKVNPSDWLLPDEQNPGTQGLLGALGILPTGTNSSQSLTLQPNAQQVWYQIQISAFNDGQRWRQAPFPTLPLPTVGQAKLLWRYLGLDTDPLIGITVLTAEGQQQSTTAVVKAASYKGGVLRLLAAGEAIPSATPAASKGKPNRLLAHTEGALRWLEPSSVTLSDLNQVQSQWVSASLPILWRELLQRGQRSPKAMPSNAAMLEQMGYLSLRLIDLTGNSEPEAVLTLYEDFAEALKKSEVSQPAKSSQQYKPRTLILSDTGSLLYSEFSQDASTSLIAIADLGDGGPAALVVNNPNTYSLKRWSTQQKRFE
jgi:hypothetical protein